MKHSTPDPALKKPGPALGPSDSSDSGSDLTGLDRTDDTSDRNGTGERMSVDEDSLEADDIGADRVVGSDEAGLGGGLDQSEEYPE